MNSILIGSGRVIYSLSIFLLTIFASRHFSVIEYGLFREFLLYWVIGIYVSGVPSINAIYYFRNKNILFEFLLFIMSYISSLIILFIFFAFIRKTYFFYIFIITPVSILYLHLESFFIMRNRNSIAFFITIFESISILITMPIAYYFNMNIHEYWKLFVNFAIFKFFIYSILFYFNSSKEKVYNFKETFKYIYPVYISSYVGIISSKTDKYIVSILFGPQVFAHYSSGAFEIPLVGRFISGVFHSQSNTIKQAMSNKNYDYLKSYFRKLINRIYIPIGILTLLFFINAEHIISFIYSQIYEDSYIYFSIYMLILPLRIVPLGFLMNLYGKTKTLMILGIFDAIFMTIFGIIFIKIFGPLGGAFAFIIITFIQILFILYFIRDFFPGNFYLGEYFLIILFIIFNWFFFRNNFIISNVSVLFYIICVYLIFGEKLWQWK